MKYVTVLWKLMILYFVSQQMRDDKEVVVIAVTNQSIIIKCVKKDQVHFCRLEKIKQIIN